MNPAYYLIFILLIIFLLQSQNNKNAWMKQHIKSRKTEDKTKMSELAKRFIEKECIIYTFNGTQITGIIKEVTDTAALIEKNGTTEAVNLDFVVRLREYPRKKNGKKKSIIAD